MIFCFCFICYYLRYFFFQTYVQDIVKTEADAIYNIIAKERGHIYVCGDCGMAEDMYNAVK
jgi:nitric-oxide synthase, brain